MILLLVAVYTAAITFCAEEYSSIRNGISIAFLFKSIENIMDPFIINWVLYLSTIYCVILLNRFNVSILYVTREV